LIEQLVTLENQHRSGSGFFFYGTHTGVEIDLLIDRGQSRIGFELKAGVAIEPRDWQHLQTGIDDGVIDRGVLVHTGSHDFMVNEKIRVAPAAQLLLSPAQW
jgi:predicted AAA+ superfamily ATPase